MHRVALILHHFIVGQFQTLEGRYVFHYKRNTSKKTKRAWLGRMGNWETTNYDYSANAANRQFLFRRKRGKVDAGITVYILYS